jgi:hypothetical protein
VVLFVNGLPLAVQELKNAADQGATIWTALQQLQTYKSEIPVLFAANAVLVVSDGSRPASGRSAPDASGCPLTARARRCTMAGVSFVRSAGASLRRRGPSGKNPLTQESVDEGGGTGVSVKGM